jgi:hypothetical protein
MIDKQCAVEIREYALKAIAELSRALNASQGRCSEEDYEKIKKGVGISIGRIQSDLLDHIYTAFPELDDLK